MNTNKSERGNVVLEVAIIAGILALIVYGMTLQATNGGSLFDTLWSIFGKVTHASASGSADVAICDTVDGNNTAAYDGLPVDNSDAQTRHCVFVSNDTVSTGKHDKQNKPVLKQDKTNKPVVVPPVDVPTVTEDKPVENDQTVVTHDDKPKHCNNGNGNGAEGCNASNKGNQDETTVKGDKAENHPSK